MFWTAMKKYIKENKEKPLSELYAKSITDLSEIDPVLSYKLTGKQDINAFLEEIESNTINHLMNNGEEQSNIEKNFEIVRPLYYSKLIEDVDAYILQIAKHINSKTLKQCKIQLEQNDKELQQEITQIVENIKMLANQAEIQT